MQFTCKLQVWGPRCGQGGRGSWGQQTAYLQRIINMTSIGQRLDKGGVGVLISLHAIAAEWTMLPMLAQRPKVISTVGFDAS